MPSKRNPTISDIAKLADVSTTTVSHVLNQTRPVSNGLRSRVNAAVRELEYKPNVMARGLRIQASKILGLIIPDNTNPFFGEMALGAEDCAFRHGYSLLLCNSRQDIARELTYISNLTSYPVDGLVLSTVSVSTEHISRLATLRPPVIIIDRKVPGLDADVILADHAQGARDAVRHLVKFGHERIAIITGPQNLVPAFDRLEGYRTVMEEEGLAVDEQLIIEGDFQFKGGQIAAQSLLTLDRPPTAIFASNDMMAIGALDTAKRLGIHVPEDLSIVGFDDIFLASLVDPTLTTVAQPAYQLGEFAVDRLLMRLGGLEPVETQEICLPTELIIRNSTMGINR